MAPTPIATQKYLAPSETKAFEDTKAGVKGLVDAGITKVPRIFTDPNYKPIDIESETRTSPTELPVIDLTGIADPTTRAKIVQSVKEACDKWGIFQIVNHEMPVAVMDGMIEGVRKFHEQDIEEKKKYYTRDATAKFQYNSNFYINKVFAASWMDNTVCFTAPNPPQPEELPEIIRDIMFEFSEHVTTVGNTVYGLLSEALGLDPNHFKDIGCADAFKIFGNYFPPCPQPELTFGAWSHVDSGASTILLQDDVGGLQILYNDQWVDVPVVPKALIINVGDFMQFITNDKFKSVRHRVLVNKDKVRISIATFVSPDKNDNVRMYGPIKELVTEDEPAIYKDTITYTDYTTIYPTPTPDGSEKLSHFKKTIVDK